MQTAWPLLLSLCLSACAPTHLARRPTGTLPTGDGLIVGRVQIAGFAPDGWDDPLVTGYGQRLLLVEFRDQQGARHVAPCRQDGLFGAVLPAGRVTLEAVNLTTPHGSWVTLQPMRPFAVDSAGGLDLGALHLATMPADADRWARLIQSETVRFQRATLPVRIAPAPDAATAGALQQWSAGIWTWSTHPLTLRQGVHDRFEALRQRLGV